MLTPAVATALLLGIPFASYGLDLVPDRGFVWMGTWTAAVFAWVGEGVTAGGHVVAMRGSRLIPQDYKRNGQSEGHPPLRQGRVALLHKE